MKKFIITAFIAAFGLSSCSTCYECTNEIPLVDASTGDTISTSDNSEEFCTADSDEVTSREDDGATCRVQ